MDSEQTTPSRSVIRKGQEPKFHHRKSAGTRLSQSPRRWHRRCVAAGSFSPGGMRAVGHRQRRGRRCRTGVGCCGSRADVLPEALAYADPHTPARDVDELGDPLNKFQEITNYKTITSSAPTRVRCRRTEASILIRGGGGK